MANDVHLILKRGTSPPATVPINVCAVAASLREIDRPLKKAGQPELRRFFECDDETWLRPADMLSAFESARAFFIDADLDEAYFDVAVEQLGPAIDVLRALPEDSVIRLEFINPKRRKPAKPKPASTGSSGRATESGSVKKKSSKKAAGAVRGTLTISEQLTAKQREYIQSLLEQYRCDADLWAFPDIERKARLAEIDKYSGLNHLDCLRRNLRQQHQLNDDECEAMVEMSLFSRDILRRGVARRIAFNNLSDLRTALSLPFRMGSLSRLRFGYPGGGDYTDAWPLLHALAAKDIAVVRRFFEVNDTPLKGSGNRSAMLIHNAMLAIVTRNEALQRNLLKPLAEQRKPVAITQPIHTVLGGIIANDSSEVAAGLAQLMKNFRRFTYLFDEGKIICFEAHGLAELALEINSSLLDKFDVAQGLPWDAAFFEWLRGESSSPVYPELAKKSPLLDKWLNRLEISDWEKLERE